MAQYGLLVLGSEISNKFTVIDEISFDFRPRKNFRFDMTLYCVTLIGQGHRIILFDHGYGALEHRPGNIQLGHLAGLEVLKLPDEDPPQQTIGLSKEHPG